MLSLNKSYKNRSVKVKVGMELCDLSNARKLLKERFGHPYTITAMFVGEITKGP